MEYEWKTDRRVYELHSVEPLMAVQGGWVSRYPLGRLRRVKNKISCKKFALERFEYGRWEYITLLCMKLDEAKLVAQTLLCAGANDD
jgi:hypothetical protein